HSANEGRARWAAKGRPFSECGSTRDEKPKGGRLRAALPASSAAALHASPLRLLLLQIERTAAHRRCAGVGPGVMLQVLLVSVVGGQLADQAPSRCQPQRQRLQVHAASAPILIESMLTCGASELGGTGRPRTTRQLTRSMSA